MITDEIVEKYWCIDGRRGDHAYWHSDGLRCFYCGKLSADIPKIEIGGAQHDRYSGYGIALQKARDEGGYHWQKDIYFKRLDDGSVRVRHFKSFNYVASWDDWIIPVQSWASIVCSVSADGETSARYSAAQDFHGRDSHSPTPAEPR